MKRRRPDLDDWEGPRAPIKLSSSGEPPTEFRLFPLGTVETTKGNFTLNAADAKACLAAQAEYGNDLSIDYGHGVFREDEGAPQRAAGWIGGLELRSDGLWAVRVSWTETAAAMLEAREQRYFSPAFETNKAGHIRRLLNVALTLAPATHNLTPLVASRRGGRAVTKRKLSMKLKYCKASDLAALADECEKMAEGEGSDAEKALNKALGAKLRKLADEAEEVETSEGDDEDDDGEGEGGDEDKKAEKEATSRIAKLAREITGETDPSEVEGALRALKSDAGGVTGLSARLAALETGSVRSRVEAVVKAHAVPGPNCKVTPAEVPDLVAWGVKDEKAMLAYLKKKAPIVAASVNHGAGAAAEATGELTADEKKVCRLSGISEDDFKKHRASQALPEGTNKL